LPAKYGEAEALTISVAPASASSCAGWPGVHVDGRARLAIDHFSRFKPFPGAMMKPFPTGQFGRDRPFIQAIDRPAHEQIMCQGPRIGRMRLHDAAYAWFGAPDNFRDRC